MNGAVTLQRGYVHWESWEAFEQTVSEICQYLPVGVKTKAVHMPENGLQFRTVIKFSCWTKAEAHPTWPNMQFPDTYALSFRVGDLPKIRNHFWISTDDEYVLMTDLMAAIQSKRQEVIKTLLWVTYRKYHTCLLFDRHLLRVILAYM